MRTRMLSLLAGTALVVGVGVANAGEPVTLIDAQMDVISAGEGTSGSVSGIPAILQALNVEIAGLQPGQEEVFAQAGAVAQGLSPQGQQSSGRPARRSTGWPARLWRTARGPTGWSAGLRRPARVRCPFRIKRAGIYGHPSAV